MLVHTHCSAPLPVSTVGGIGRCDGLRRLDRKLSGLESCYASRPIVNVTHR